jgi:hypothetical protein
MTLFAGSFFFLMSRFFRYIRPPGAQSEAIAGAERGEDREKQELGR